MGNIAIRVENVSKLYRLGELGTGTITHDLNRWIAKIRGKDDPYAKIGQVNARDQKAQSDYVWSLKDINFDIEQGKAVGIVGRNGAGKSTLLKVLSRITAPTTGSIKLRGRMASLLEVGTGFHPDLTGRENVYLNGAIMGMTKTEISSKMDEIVAFSGCEAYIDTPVKRYSSGMTVRLGFAVAAHLEPEILVVDEVLAVGDAEFQRKCIGKMKDVSSEGRTVLFVSHNMTAVNSLCEQAIYLKHGQMINMGTAGEIVHQYLNEENTSNTEVSWDGDARPGDDVVRINSAQIIDENGKTLEFVKMEEKFGIRMTYELLKSGFTPNPNFHIVTGKNELAFVAIEPKHIRQKEKGIHEVTLWIDGDLLNDDTYSVRIAVDSYNPFIVHAEVKEALYFEVVENINLRLHEFTKKLPGIIRPSLQWDGKLK